MAMDGTVDIVCGTSQARLLTADLSNGSSRCIAYNGEPLTPCEFEHRCGRSASINHKLLLHYNSKPLPTFLHMYNVNKRHLHHFTHPSEMSTSQLAGDPPVIDTSSQQSADSLTKTNESTPNSGLPVFAPASDPVFTWGSVESELFCHSLDATYCEIVYWRINSFKIPSGSVGRNFVLE